MKLLSTILTAFCLVGGMVVELKAQEDEGPKTQMLMIHVDHVMTSKTVEYEAASKAFNDAAKEQGIENIDTWTHSQSNGDYMFVSPIDKMADLDESPFSAMKEKMGEDAWKELYSKFNGTYLEHESFIVNHHPKYSYKMDQLGKSGDYRVWTYMYFEDQYWGEMIEATTKWKKLYEEKGIESGFGIYTNGFGYPGPVLVVLEWAHGPAEYYEREAKKRAALGEDGKKLWGETMQYIYDHKVVDGWFRPELSIVTGDASSASAGTEE